MAAKKKVVEEVKVFNPFSKEKHDELLSIMRTPMPTKEQKDNILANFRLYINPDQSTYTEGCTTCGNSINSLFAKLRDFFNLNVDKFEK